MNKKNTLVIIILVLVGAVVFWKRNFIKQKLDFIQGKTSESDNLGPAPITPGVVYSECKSFPLKLGCKGKHVQTVQKALNKLHGSGLKEDGYFGPKTETALLANGYGETVEKEDMARIVKALISG